MFFLRPLILAVFFGGLTGMMPLWIFLLSGFFLPEGSAVQVPYLDLAISLILLTVPISIGLLIRRYARKVADFVTLKFIKPFSFVLLFIVFGVSHFDLIVVELPKES